MLKIKKLMNNKILFFLMLISQHYCAKNNNYLSVNTAAGVELIELEDFKLENVYFSEEECKENKSMFCMTKENAQKYVNNIIALRKVLNEREEKFYLVKEIALNR